jgi:dihydroorotase
MSNTDIVKSVKAGKILFQGGHILDPGSGLDKTADLSIIDGKIEKIGSIDGDGWDGDIIDCKGKIIVPGLIDMHVHLREPGHEDAETIESGCRAAMAGGFTAVCCMPNTQPVIDSRGHVEFIRERASGQMVDVHPIAAVTKGQKGEEITEMGDILAAGAVGFSDDGHPVRNAGILRRALEYASMLDHPIIDHCEDMSLSEGGVMNEGSVSTVLGMRGIPPISEDIHIARDILVAEYTGGHIHIAHVSTKGGVRLIRDAKNRGVRVTAETCPHYLVLTDEAVRSFDTSTKMKPPLRTEEDQKALWEGLRDGTIDVITSDHAPHAFEVKETEYDAAAFGIIGLETMVGLIMTQIAEKKKITLSSMVEKMAIHPRKILRLPENRIEEGQSANMTLLDPDQKWTVDKHTLQSKSRNTPYHGWTLHGKSMGVVNKGQIFLHQPKV